MSPPCNIFCLTWWFNAQLTTMSFLNIIYYFTCCTFSRKRSIMLSVRWICSLYISLEDEISFDWSTCVSNVFISPFISPNVSIARKRQDIMESVEGWHSTCNNVFFYKFFVSMHWNRFFAYWMGGLKRVFGTLHWDILWKDGLNHVICDYLNRELGSIDKIVH